LNILYTVVSLLYTGEGLRRQGNEWSGACSTAHRSNRPDHWDGAYVRQVSCWTTYIVIQ